MIHKAGAYLWSARKEFFKYAVVGGTGVVLDIGSLAILKEWFGWAPVAAVVVNQICILGYNFTLNKYWSFQNRDLPHSQLVRYLTLAGWNYAFSVMMMFFFNHLWQVDYLLVRIVSIGIMVSWNFLLYKRWVYRGQGTQ